MALLADLGGGLRVYLDPLSRQVVVGVHHGPQPQALEQLRLQQDNHDDDLPPGAFFGDANADGVSTAAAATSSAAAAAPAPLIQDLMYLSPAAVALVRDKAERDLVAVHAPKAYLSAVLHYDFLHHLRSNPRNIDLFEAARHIDENHLIYIDRVARDTNAPATAQAHADATRAGDTTRAPATFASHRLATCKNEALRVFPRATAFQPHQTYRMAFADVRRLRPSPIVIQQARVLDTTSICNPASGTSGSKRVAAPHGSTQIENPVKRPSKSSRRREKARRKEAKKRAEESSPTKTQNNTDGGGGGGGGGHPVTPPHSSPPDVPDPSPVLLAYQGGSERPSGGVPTPPELVHILGPLLIPSDHTYEGITIGYAPKGFQESGFVVAVDILHPKRPVWLVYDYFPLDPETGTWRSAEEDEPVALRNDTLGDVFSGIHSRLGGREHGGQNSCASAAAAAAAEGAQHSKGLFDMAMIMDSLDKWRSLTVEQMEQTLLATATRAHCEFQALPLDEAPRLAAVLEASSGLLISPDTSPESAVPASARDTRATTPASSPTAKDKES